MVLAKSVASRMHWEKKWESLYSRSLIIEMDRHWVNINLDGESDTIAEDRDSCCWHGRVTTHTPWMSTITSPEVLVISYDLLGLLDRYPHGGGNRPAFLAHLNDGLEQCGPRKSAKLFPRRVITVDLTRHWDRQRPWKNRARRFRYIEVTTDTV